MRPAGGEVHAGRPPRRHRRRQPRGDGRGDAGGQPVPAPPGPAALAARLLAQPPEPVLPVQRPVHRPDEPAPPHRRGAAGRGARAGDRLRPAEAPDAARRAVDRGPAVPQHPDRHDGQHAPDRVLHRQDVLARQLLRPARPGGVPRLRDAAAPRDGRRADAADAHRRRRVLAGAVRRAAWCAGARGCTTTSCCRTTSGRTCRTRWRS